VYGRFIRDGIAVEPLVLYLQQTSIEIVVFDQEQALQAAEIFPLTKPYGLSLGDRACIGLAKIRNLAVLTADIAWTEINGLNVDVISIR
jgi:PIN domain nuclease of toxin-antitoxin system